VVLPENLTTIGFRAFDDCTGLANVTFPDSLTAIGDSAFRNCVGLTSVTLPSGVDIGEEAFDSSVTIIYR
jgi:hypothetical protein